LHDIKHLYDKCGFPYFIPMIWCHVDETCKSTSVFIYAGI
jgi:hypothetical protein